MAHLDSISTLLTALGPVATAALAWWMKRSDRRKLQRMDHQSERIDVVADQVTPNGGASLRDAVDRIERKVCDLHDTVERNSRRLDGLEGRRTWRGC